MCFRLLLCLLFQALFAHLEFWLAAIHSMRHANLYLRKPRACQQQTGLCRALLGTVLPSHDPRAREGRGRIALAPGSAAPKVSASEEVPWTL